MSNQINKLFHKVYFSLIKFYQNLPIRYKLMLVLNVIMITSLVVLSYVNYRNSEETLTKKSTQYTQDILKLVEYRVKDYVQNLNLISQDLLPDSNLLMNMNEYSTSSNPLQVYEETFVVENHLKKTIFTRDEVQSAALITAQGNYYPADKNNRVASIKQIVPNGSQLYIEMLAEARKKSGSPIFYLDLEDGRVKNLFMARMAYNVNDYKEMGLLVILLRKEYLDTAFKDLVNEDTRNIMILSSLNEVVVERDSNHREDITQILPSIKSSKGWFLDASKENIISYLVMDERPEWKIVSFVSLGSLYKDIESLKKKTIGTSLVIVFVLSTISLLMTSDFIRPFKKLMTGMEKVQKGDHNVQITLNRKDEIGYLGEAFNRMVKEMNTLSNWVYQEQLTRKEAEIKALQAQINPHFLFNTLESINWMSHLNNVPEISEMVTSLSSLMEATIGRDDKLITFEEELHYIDNYSLIIKKRFEDRIELDKHIDPDVLEVKIPRLLIQPLIENAIYHGIEKDRAKGVITLSASINNRVLSIMVEDDGEGIDEEELEIINENLAMDNEAYFKRLNSKKGTSIGLDNVNRRIKLFYGEQYGLIIESKKHVYTKVLVSIPLDVKSSPFTGGVLSV